jgi:hypothetical protein
LHTFEENRQVSQLIVLSRQLGTKKKLGQIMMLVTASGQKVGALGRGQSLPTGIQSWMTDENYFSQSEIVPSCLEHTEVGSLTFPSSGLF